jgi:hypothetical protein
MEHRILSFNPETSFPLRQASTNSVSSWSYRPLHQRAGGFRRPVALRNLNSGVVAGLE